MFNNGFQIQHGYSKGVNTHTQWITFPIYCSLVGLYVTQFGLTGLYQNLSCHGFANTGMFVTTNDTSANLPEYHWLVVGRS